MKDADYITLSLPYNWGRSPTMCDGSAKLTGSLATSKTGKTYGAVVVTYSTNNVVVTLKTGEKLLE
jgi:predicted neutral ceramidase superfamily lipid hydrolase